MKYYFVRVYTQYDGYEWVTPDVVEAESEEKARDKVKAADYTHGDNSEVQELESIKEISQEDYAVLSKYI